MTCTSSGIRAHPRLLYDLGSLSGSRGATSASRSARSGKQAPSSVRPRTRWLVGNDSNQQRHQYCSLYGGLNILDYVKVARSPS